LARRILGSGQRSASLFGPEAAHRDSCNHEFVGGPQCGREEARIEVSEHTLRLVEAPDQEHAPDLEIAGMCGIQRVTMPFERCPRSLERFGRQSQVAQGECDLGLGDYAPRAGYGFFRTEGARSAPQQFLRSRELAELRHRDSPKRERWRIVAQRNSLQCTERITRCERPCCSRDQRVHRNPATLVTPTFSILRVKYSAWSRGYIENGSE
jgi:hypothetical protein